MRSGPSGSRTCMTDLRPKTEETIDIYNQNMTPWADVEQAIVDNPAKPGQSYWLATTNADGSPHLVGIGTIFVDGRFWLTSGPGTRKSRNLERDPRCVISTALPTQDISIEGEVSKVTDQGTLERIAAAYAEHGWAPTVRDGAFWHDFSAQTAGPPPWELYEMRPTRAYGLGTQEPYGATRWTF
jgi:hypothetical protein